MYDIKLAFDIETDFMTEQFWFYVYGIYIDNCSWESSGKPLDPLACSSRIDPLGQVVVILLSLQFQNFSAIYK